MADSRLRELAGCLKKASDICSEIAQTPEVEESNNQSSVSSNITNTASSSVNSRVSSIVSNARTLINASYRNGNFSRLNQRQRLRALSSTNAQPRKKAKLEDIPIEFVLLYNLFEEEEAHYPVVFTEENIAVRGFIQITKDFTEKNIRDCLATAVQVQYPQVSSQDFEFLKATRRKLTKPVTSSNFQFDYKQLKVLTGQGSLYVKLKNSYDFLLENNDEDDDDDDNENVVRSPPVARNTSSMSDESQLRESGDSIASANHEENSANAHELTTNVHIPFDREIETWIEKCKQSQNPVEILAFMQKHIITGRKLELTEESLDVDVSNSETNFVVIDRHSVLSSALEEFKDITNFRTTLEVSFVGEAAKDLGGPRKEFFRLALKEIKDRYFPDNKLLNENYCDLKEVELVGIILSLSILQNGPMPKFFEEDLLVQLFSQDSTSPSVNSLRKGMDILGLVRIGMKLPLFLHLFRKNDVSILSRKKLVELLRPNFSEEGTNRKQNEMTVYTFFLKFCRETASGRVKDLSLGDILTFITGAEDEPILGFAHHPNIRFDKREYTAGEAIEFIPTANTCSNTLVLYIPQHNFPLPNEGELFKVYRMAFLNNFFGVI